MENTDKSLIDAHCKGDSSAFGQLVRRHGDSLLGYLMKITHDRDQAEDFFQETFKRVHEKAATFRGGQFRAWLFTIATRVAISGFRRGRRRQTISLDAQADCAGAGCVEPALAAAQDESPGPSQQAIRAEEIRQVRAAVGSLPARQRATVVLAYYQHLNYRQVAAIMNCSVGTVKKQMYRALATLARKLPDVAGEEK